MNNTNNNNYTDLDAKIAELEQNLKELLEAVKETTTETTEARDELQKLKWTRSRNQRIYNKIYEK